MAAPRGRQYHPLEIRQAEMPQTPAPGQAKRDGVDATQVRPTESQVTMMQAADKLAQLVAESVSLPSRRRHARLPLSQHLRHGGPKRDPLGQQKPPPAESDSTATPLRRHHYRLDSTLAADLRCPCLPNRRGGRQPQPRQIV